MKNYKSKIPVIFRILIITSAAVIVLSSCNEGLFNFSDETGNVSISFTASGVPTQLDKVEITLTNDERDDKIERNCDIYDSSGSQQADAYISRIDTGSWRIYIKVFNSEGLVVGEREDSFDLSLGQTVIAEYDYYDGGVVDLFFEAPSGGQPVSLVELYSIDVLIHGYHFDNEPVENTSYGTALIADGSGFDSYLSGLRVDYPDGSYFDYGGGWSRLAGGAEVEVQPDVISINRSGYLTWGNYRLTLTDTNGTESEITDSCYFDYPADLGLITFNTDAYAGGNIDPGMYSMNYAPSDGSVFAYIVSRSDGTIVSGSLDVLVLDTFDDASYSMTIPGAGDYYIVIVTLDVNEAVAAPLIIADYSPGSTNLAPERVPGWLYGILGEQLNYVGVSVADWTF